MTTPQEIKEAFATQREHERYRSASSKPVRVSIDFGKNSRTKQSFAKSCDINTIMAQYKKHGLIDHVNKYGGNYGDFLSATDYTTSMNQILAADDAFNSLPSALRTRFDNDPAAFLDFVSDPNNKEAMIELGLASKPTEAASMPAKDSTEDTVAASPDAAPTHIAT